MAPVNGWDTMPCASSPAAVWTGSTSIWKKRGVLTMLILSIFPIAPFTMVNMAAGASDIHFRDYLIGSAIGLLPGTLIAVLLKYQVYSTLKQPSGVNLGLMAAVIVIVMVVVLLLRGRIRERLDRYFALQ